MAVNRCHPQSRRWMLGSLLVSCLVCINGSDYGSASLFSGALKVTAMRQDMSPSSPTCANPPLDSPRLDTQLGVFLPVTVGTARNLIGNLPGQHVNYPLVMGAAWNAFAAYHPDAEPISKTGIPRRPTAEHTVRNRNVALAFAALGAAEVVGPGATAYVTAQFKLLGLNPADKCTQDLSKPACVGYKAAAAMAQLLEDNGANRKGCIGYKTESSCAVFNNWAPYEPVNTVYRINDPFRWQPLREHNGEGYFWVQELWQAHLGAKMKPVVLSQQQFDSTKVQYNKPSTKQYKAQVDQVLANNTRLADNDFLKMRAEQFDNARYAREAMIKFAKDKNMNLVQAIAFFQHFQVRSDGVWLALREKLRYDTVRPMSAVRYVYGDKMVRAYAGPKLGNVMMPGNEWRPYMFTSAEGEFPSGAVCLATIFAEWLEIWLGKAFTMPYKFPKGCSFREPDVTPKADVSGVFKSADEIIKAAQEGRVLGGVHFPQAVEGGRKLCTGLSNIGYKWLKAKLPSLDAELAALKA